MKNENKTNYIKLPSSIFNLSGKPAPAADFGKEFAVLVYEIKLEHALTRGCVFIY